MNFLKQSAFIAVFAFMGLPTVQAEEVATLPTIRVILNLSYVKKWALSHFKKIKSASGSTTS